MVSIKKIKKVYHDDGIGQLLRKSIRYGYDNYIRPKLPLQTVTYNEVTVLASRWGDQFIPWHTVDISGYEEALGRGLRQHVSHGDTVVIVGGGWGVTSVIAAEQAGEQGRVVTFEGSANEIENIRQTLELNGAADQVNIRHTVVAEAISLRGDRGDAEAIAPSELPDCDVLVLDCEGAETEIIDEMEIQPETLLVETHGMLGAPPDKVSSQLEQSGYNIVSNTVAEERVRSVCEEKGIYVLVAERT